MVGFEMSPPPFLSLSRASFNKQIFRGINFGSGGSGILDRTGKTLGVFMSMNRQIRYFASVAGKLTEKMGPAAAELLLAKSLFLISTGSNDFFQNFNIYDSQNYTYRHSFLVNLASTYKGQLRRLYKMGARKFGIVSIPPIGCCPSQRSQNASGGCLDFFNDLALNFIAATEGMPRDLSMELKGMKYSLGNAYAMVANIFENPIPFRFKDLTAACCGGGKLNGEKPCRPSANLCSNRREYLFWDLYHPTQAASKLAAQTLYGGLSRFVTPINIRQLVMDEN